MVRNEVAAGFHVLRWWLDDSPRLPIEMRDLISDPERTVFVRAATMWEIRIKQKVGKQDLSAQFCIIATLSTACW